MLTREQAAGLAVGHRVWWRDPFTQGEVLCRVVNNHNGTLRLEHPGGDVTPRLDRLRLAGGPEADDWANLVEAALAEEELVFA
jgi:hypothetical protein